MSVDISAECRSPYRPIVSTDTRSKDALSTHDPSTVLLKPENYVLSKVLSKAIATSQMPLTVFYDLVINR